MPIKCCPLSRLRSWWFYYSYVHISHIYSYVLLHNLVNLVKPRIFLWAGFWHLVQLCLRRSLACRAWPFFFLSLHGADFSPPHAMTKRKKLEGLATRDYLRLRLATHSYSDCSPYRRRNAWGALGACPHKIYELLRNLKMCLSRLSYPTLLNKFSRHCI